MFDSIRARLAFAVLVVVIASVGLVIAISYSGKNNSSSNTVESSGSAKRIIAFDRQYNQTTHTYDVEFRYMTVQYAQVSSAIGFLDPFGKTMTTVYPQQLAGYSGTDPNAGLSNEQKQAILNDADQYEHYLLIRLPEALGDWHPNATAFRAYSQLDPESHCYLNYSGILRNGNFSAVLIDPCHSDVFRVWDGYVCSGHIGLGLNPVVSGYNAIPRMRLAIDDQGYLVAIKPDEMPSGDGTVGEGRLLSGQDIGSIKGEPSCNFWNAR